MSTVAGSGSFQLGSLAGDGGQATESTLNPYDVALDASGNIYIADNENYAIRKVTVSTGVITTVAGTGTSGYSGDGGQATEATLKNPRGVSVDASGNIHIADSYNNVIRKVTVVTGVITTVAGTGTSGLSGDGGQATEATMRSPRAVVVDASGNIYIADTSSGRIRKVTVSTGIITTVAGGGSQSYSGDVATSTSIMPFDVALDTSGNIYIADWSNNVIRKITESSGTITTMAGTGTSGYSGDGGQATEATLNGPNGVSIDTLGDIYIADSSNHVIRKVTVSTGLITTVAGTGTSGYGGDGEEATSANLRGPYHITVETPGTFYIVNLYTYQIRKVTETEITYLPTPYPTAIPTITPTAIPTAIPSPPPTSRPSMQPTSQVCEM
jgi:streptogramin lyase